MNIPTFDHIADLEFRATTQQLWRVWAFCHEQFGGVPDMLSELDILFGNQGPDSSYWQARRRGEELPKLNRQVLAGRLPDGAAEIVERLRNNGLISGGR